MKFKTNKLLAVTLSLILIFTCLLPILQFGISAQEENQTLNAIKTAWSNLKHDPEVLLDTFWYKDGSNWVTDSGVDTEVELGVSVKTYKFTGTNPYIISVPKGSGSRDFENANSTIDIDDYESIYFYSNTGNTGSFNIQVVSSDKSTSKYTTISHSNEWIKTDILTFLSKDANKDFYNDPENSKGIGRIQMDGNAQNGEFSTLFGVKKNNFPDDSATADWDIIDWYYNAKELDINSFPDNAEKEAFNTALSEAKTQLMKTQEGKIKLIKGAWERISPKAVVVRDKFYAKTTSNNSWAPYTNTTTVKINDVDYNVVSKVTDVKTLILMGEVDLSRSGCINYPTEYLNINDFAQLYFYYTADSNFSGNVQIGYGKDGGNKGAFYAASKLNATAEFKKFDILNEISVREESSPGMVDNFNGTTNQFTRIHLDAAPTGIVISPIIGVKTFEKEFGFKMEDTASWSFKTWVSKAAEFNWDNYDGGAELKSLLTEFSAGPQVEAIQKAWEKLSYKPEVLLDTFWYKDGSNWVTDSGVDTEVESGVSVKTYKFTDTNPYIISVPKGNGSRDFENVNSTIDIDDYQSIYFYSNTGKTGTFNIQVVSSNRNTAKYTTISHSENWIKTDILPFLSKTDNKDFYNNPENSKGVGRIQMDGNVQNGEFSTLFGIKKNNFPDDSVTAAWELVDWYYAAKALNLDEFVDDEACDELISAIASARKELLSTDEGKIALIKGAWEKVSINPEVLFDKFYVKTNTNSKWHLYKNAVTNNIDGVDYQVISKPQDVTALILEGDVADPNNINVGRPMDYYDIDNYSEIYFYYTSDEQYSGNINLGYCKDTSIKGDFTSATKMEKTSVWKKYDILGVINKRADKLNYYNGTDENYLGRIFFSSALTNSVVSQLIGVKSFEAEFGFNLNDTADWKLSDWVIKASEIDFSIYKNSEDIIELMKIISTTNMNLTSHMPVDVYRTDSGGNITKVPESEFGLTHSKMLCDSEFDSAINLARNNSTVDFVYNLSKVQEINEFNIYTLTDNIKHLKIYASIAVDGIWREDSLVYQYDQSVPLSNEFVEILDTSQKMRYVRFSIIDAVGTELDITEIGVMGARSQELLYHNLLAKKSDSVTTFLQDKETFATSVVRTDAFRFGKNAEMLSYESITDKNEDTVYDFFIGTKKTKSLNFLIDLQGLTSIDSIVFNSGGTERYYPTNMNFYIGEDDKEIFSKDAKAIKSYTQAEENGVYQYDFVPVAANYVRIEVVDNGLDYYYDNLLTVVSELMVYGINVSGTVNDDTVASFTDADTGIRVDILAKSNNDLFELVTGIKVTQREPKPEELEQAKTLGLKFNGNFYTIKLIDYLGNEVTDVGGREIRVVFPIPKGINIDNAYAASILNGELIIMEQDNEKDSNIIVIFDNPSNIILAPVSFSQTIDDFVGIEEPDYENDDTITDSTDNIEELEEETQESTRKKVYKKVKKNNDNVIDTWIIVVIIVIAVIVIAGAILIIVFRKNLKRK